MACNSRAIFWLSLVAKLKIADVNTAALIPYLLQLYK